LPARFSAGGVTGSFTTNSFFGDLKVGHLFTLVDTFGGAQRALVTKTPPRAASGYALLLDVSTHASYYTGLSDGFTDSTGFTVGDYRSHFGDVGARAQLDWLIRNSSILWVPYVGATIDQRFGYHDSLTIPSQGGAAADTVTFSHATTFGGARLGFYTLMASDWEFGAHGFYEASSDISFIGGQGYVKVHF
jgi:hypothetical protein